MRRILTLAVMVSGLIVGVFAAVAAAQAYPVTTVPPIVVGGTVVTAPIQVGGTRASLPFTGGGDTVSYVLVGLIVIAIGVGLVIATRRRAELLNRS